MLWETQRTFDDSGVLYQQRAEVKWGLMTFDGRVSGSPLAEGLFSYPEAGAGALVNGQLAEVGLDLPANFAQIAQLVPEDGLWAGVFFRLANEDLSRPNLGLRNTNALFGQLIGGSKGISDAQRDFNVLESDQTTTTHNFYVAETVRKLVPSGGAPIAAALHDALRYYEGEAANGGDAQNRCRRRLRSPWTPN